MVVGGLQLNAPEAPVAERLQEVEPEGVGFPVQERLLCNRLSGCSLRVDVPARCQLRLLKFPCLLQVHPEWRRRSEVACESQRRVRADASLAFQDHCHAIHRYAERFCQDPGRQHKLVEFVLPDLAGMYRLQAVFLSISHAFSDKQRCPHRAVPRLPYESRCASER